MKDSLKRKIEDLERVIRDQDNRLINQEYTIETKLFEQKWYVNRVEVLNIWNEKYKKQIRQLSRELKENKMATTKGTKAVLKKITKKQVIKKAVKKNK